MNTILSYGIRSPKSIQEKQQITFIRRCLYYKL